MTCHPQNQLTHDSHAQECTALAGPILLTLQWLVEFVDKHGDFAVAVFTAVLALFTFRLYTATAGLKESTDKLWKAGEDQMKLIASNADQQSRDMNASIAVARQAMTWNRRAWLPIDKVYVIPKTLVSDRILITCAVQTRNIGDSPATSVDFAIKAFFPSEKTSLEETANEFKKQLRSHPPQWGRTVFPRQPSVLEAKSDIGPKIEDAIVRTTAARTRQLSVLVCVGICYRIAIDSEPHITCALYEWSDVPVDGLAISRLDQSKELPIFALWAGEAD